MSINSVSEASKLIANQIKAEKNFTAGPELTKQFSNLLNEAMQDLKVQGEEVEQLRQSFMAGQFTDPHTLMIAAEKASLGLELTVQVRNKVIEAYQEIMRTQI